MHILGTPMKAFSLIRSGGRAQNCAFRKAFLIVLKQMIFQKPPLKHKSLSSFALFQINFEKVEILTRFSLMNKFHSCYSDFSPLQ